MLPRVLFWILICLCFVLLFWILAFQQLEIDYVIGESHKELLPSSSGPAAIIRIFGVTKEGLVYSVYVFFCAANLGAYTIGDKHCWFLFVALIEFVVVVRKKDNLSSLLDNCMIDQFRN